MKPSSSAGVGFARMESREKCEQIIQLYNGYEMPAAKDPLLVKFADGGPKKKNPFKSPDNTARTWREVSAEGIPVTYDPTIPQNGVSVVSPLGVPYTRFATPPTSYAIQGGSQAWIPYTMMPQGLAPSDEQVSLLFVIPV